MALHLSLVHRHTVELLHRQSSYIGVAGKLFEFFLSEWHV
jgi:hypothetical protein